MGCNIMRPKYIGKHVLLWTRMPYSEIQISYYDAKSGKLTHIKFGL